MVREGYCIKIEDEYLIVEKEDEYVRVERHEFDLLDMIVKERWQCRNNVFGHTLAVPSKTCLRSHHTQKPGYEHRQPCL